MRVRRGNGCELAACGPEAREKYNRVKAEKQVTAATSDLVAAALVAIQLYMQWNAWPLLDGLGIDGAAVRAALEAAARAQQRAVTSAVLAAHERARGKKSGAVAQETVRGRDHVA